MNDYKELLAELRKCKYCAKDIAKYAADAIEQLVAEYNELDKAHGELFIEYHKVKKNSVMRLLHGCREFVAIASITMA